MHYLPIDYTSLAVDYVSLDYKYLPVLAEISISNMSHFIRHYSRESYLVSIPPLTYMLKFAGSPCHFQVF
jgi:threonyl-tRNA synthetase